MDELKELSDSELVVEIVARLQEEVATQREVIINLNAMNDELQAKLDKVDKAIEEMEKTENTQEHTSYDGDINIKGAFNDGIEKALEILKRNIGEDKEND